MLEGQLRSRIVLPYSCTGSALPGPGLTGEAKSFAEPLEVLAVPLAVSVDVDVQWTGLQRHRLRQAPR